MNKFVDPPCLRLKTTSFLNGMILDEEVGETSSFAEPVGSAVEGELQIGEKTTRKLCPLILCSSPILRQRRKKRSGVRLESPKAVGQRSHC